MRFLVSRLSDEEVEALALEAAALCGHINRAVIRAGRKLQGV